MAFQIINYCDCLNQPHIFVPLNVFVVFKNNSCSVTFHCNPKILTNLTRFFVLGLNDFRDKKKSNW